MCWGSILPLVHYGYWYNLLCYTHYDIFDITACFFLRNTPTVNKTVFQICAYLVKFNIVCMSRVQKALPLLHGLC